MPGTPWEARYTMGGPAHHGGYPLHIHQGGIYREVYTFHRGFTGVLGRFFMVIPGYSWVIPGFKPLKTPYKQAINPHKPLKPPKKTRYSRLFRYSWVIPGLCHYTLVYKGVLVSFGLPFLPFYAQSW